MDALAGIRRSDEDAKRGRQNNHFEGMLRGKKRQNKGKGKQREWVKDRY